MAAGGVPTQVADFTAVPQPDHCTTTMATMWQHQQDGLFTDVIIKVKDTSIPCHRLVLSSACAYFADFVLTSDFKEQKESEIHFESLEPDVMMNIVTFLYGQDATFKSDSLTNILEATQILRLHSVKNQIVQFMSNNISVDNSLSWWKLSSKYGMKDLRKTFIEMILANITEIGASEEFKALTIDELIHIMKAEGVELESTDDLVMACVEWVDHEPQARRGNSVDIMKNINLSKCSSETLKNIYKKYQDLLHDVNVYGAILNELFERLPGPTGNAAITGNKRLVLLGGMADIWNKNLNNKCFVTCTVDRFQWEEFMEIPVGIQAIHSPIVVTNDGFIVFCGYGSGGRHKEYRKTTKYDAKSKTWQNLPDSPVAMREASAVLCANSVYLLSGGNYVQSYGSGYFEPLASVYRLDLASLSWHREADMPEGLQWPIAAALNTNIYVLNHKKLTMFAAKTTRTWQQKCDLPQGAAYTNGSCLVASDHRLYLVGGCFKITECYDEATDVWTLLTPPSITHNQGSAALLNGKIYLVGDTRSDHSDVSVYDIENNQWSVLPVNLPFKQISFCRAAFVEWL